MPACRADFAVLVGKVHRIDHAEHFVDVTSERKIVDDGMADGSVRVDQERSAECDAAIFKKNIVIAGDRFCQVSDERIANLSDTALFDRRVFPCKMGKV